MSDSDVGALSDGASRSGVYLRLELLRPDPGLVCLRASGELDWGTGSSLSVALACELDAGPPLIIVLDLSGITFCSVAGLNVLLGARSHARAIGCVVSLDHLSRAMRRAIHAVGLDDELRMRSPSSAAPSVIDLDRRGDADSSNRPEARGMS